MLLADVDAGRGAELRRASARLSAPEPDRRPARDDVLRRRLLAARSEPLDYEQLFTRADAALYRAKHDGPRSRRRRGGLALRDGRPRRRSRARGERARLRAPTRQARRRRPETSPIEAVHAADARAPRPRSAPRPGSWLVRDDGRARAPARPRTSHPPAQPARRTSSRSPPSSAPPRRTAGSRSSPPLLAAIAYNLVEDRLDHFRRPEYALGVMWLVTQAANAVGIGVVHFSSDDPPLYAVQPDGHHDHRHERRLPAPGTTIGVSFAALLTIAAGVAHQLVARRRGSRDHRDIRGDGRVGRPHRVGRGPLGRRPSRRRGRRPRSPGMLNRDRARGARGRAHPSRDGRRPAGRRSSSPTSTTSSTSTTRYGHAPATRCCSRSPTASASTCARSSRPTGSAARSSSCCCRA